MKTLYSISAGTSVAVSRNSGDFRPYTLQEALQFKSPAITTAAEMYFEMGTWRIRVNRTKVSISKLDEPNGLPS